MIHQFEMLFMSNIFVKFVLDALISKTEKQTTNYNLAWILDGVCDTLNLPQRQEMGQRTKLPLLNSQ
jgi:hypothetical protein